MEYLLTTPTPPLNEIWFRFIEGYDPLSSYTRPNKTGYDAYGANIISYFQKQIVLDYKTFYKLEFDDTVKYLNGSTFAGSYSNSMLNVVEIVLPDAIEYSGNSTFQGCSNLERIVNGTQLNLMKFGVFRYCSSLKEIIFQSTTPSDFLNENCLNEIRTAAPNCKLYVPYSQLDNYKNANYWANVSDMIYPYVKLKYKYNNTYRDVSSIFVKQNDEWTDISNTEYDTDYLKDNLLFNGN